MSKEINEKQPVKDPSKIEPQSAKKNSKLDALLDSERKNLQKLFDQYDLDQSKSLEVEELQKLINDQMSANKGDKIIPNGLSDALLQIHDTNNDGFLDFDEFYQLCQEHSWLDVFKNKESEMTKVRELFKKFDTDNSGYIEIKELHTLIHEHPEECKDFPKGLLKMILKAHDENGDGRLDFNEFINMSQKQSWIPSFRKKKLSNEEERRKIKLIFDKYDTDKSGAIDVKELKRLVKEPGTDLPKGLTKELLKEHDDDGNGELDFEEFFKLSQEHSWVIGDWCMKYCQYIVPGSYDDEMKFFPPPLGMLIFSLIEILFYVIDAVHEKKFDNNQIDGPVADIFVYRTKQRVQIWRFLTYMFVHIGIGHLVMNVIVQLFLGICLELVHGWKRLTLVYMSGVLAGSLGTSVFSPCMALAGASGGVYAIIAAHIATIILNWKEMRSAWMQLLFFLVFCGTDFGVALHKNIVNPGKDSVGYIAHLGGAIAGLCVGIAVLKNLHVEHWEQKLINVSTIVFSILVISATGFHLINSEHFDIEKNCPKNITDLNNSSDWGSSNALNNITDLYNNTILSGSNPFNSTL